MLCFVYLLRILVRINLTGSLGFRLEGNGAFFEDFGRPEACFWSVLGVSVLGVSRWQWA